MPRNGWLATIGSISLLLTACSMGRWRSNAAPPPVMQVEILPHEDGQTLLCVGVLEKTLYGLWCDVGDRSGLNRDLLLRPYSLKAGTVSAKGAISLSAEIKWQSEVWTWCPEGCFYSESGSFARIYTDGRVVVPEEMRDFSGTVSHPVQAYAWSEERGHTLVHGAHMDNSDDGDSVQFLNVRQSKVTGQWNASRTTAEGVAYGGTATSTYPNGQIVVLSDSSVFFCAGGTVWRWKHGASSANLVYDEPGNYQHPRFVYPSMALGMEADETACAWLDTGQMLVVHADDQCDLIATPGVACLAGRVAAIGPDSGSAWFFGWRSLAGDDMWSWTALDFRAGGLREYPVRPALADGPSFLADSVGVGGVITKRLALAFFSDGTVLSCLLP